MAAQTPAAAAVASFSPTGGLHAISAPTAGEIARRAETLRIVKTEWPYVTRVFWYRELADNNTTNSSGYGLITPKGTVKPALAQIPAIYAAG